MAIPGKLGGGNFARLSAFPGFHKWQDRNLVFRTTGANLLYVLNTWPDAEWIGGSEDIKNQYLSETERANEIAKVKGSAEAVLPDDSGFPYRRPPMEHQRRAFCLSRDTKAFGLFCEQGTGKTKIIIDTACYLYRKGEIDALIVVAWPNGVHRNWIEYEVPADVSVPYKADFWSTSNASTLYRQRDIAALLDNKSCLRIFAFNIEAFVSPKAKHLLLQMLGKWRCLFVIDQSASIKNPSALRTKFLIDKASPLASYRRVLDGQPVAEGADELYSQFKFLDPWIIGHDTWTGFKAEFCEIGFWNEIKGYKNLEELHRRIDGHCYRILASECLDLPERIYKRWAFDLSDNETRIFRDLKGKDLAFFHTNAVASVGEVPFYIPEEGKDTGPEYLQESRALVKSLRLQQISSGWWPGDDFRAIEEVPSRLRALLKLLEAVEGKCLIFSRFTADLKTIAATLGSEAVSYHGEIDEEDRAEAKRAFMNDRKIRYFIGQPQTAGLGHTLTAAANVIFYSNGPSLRLREECEKRAHRKGLKHRLLIWDLVAKGTHDEKIVNALRDKKELANEILRDPDEFFLVYE